MSSGVAPRIDSIAVVAVKRRPSYAPVRRGPVPGFHCKHRTDQVGKPLENVDAHGAVAKETEAGKLVEGALEGRIGDDRRAARRKHRNEIADSPACPGRRSSEPRAA